jgi:hypothetical protein
MPAGSPGGPKIYLRPIGGVHHRFRDFVIADDPAAVPVEQIVDGLGFQQETGRRSWSEMISATFRP